jgi:tripartite ATP-independent transporter DctM subunit
LDNATIGLISIAGMLVLIQLGMHISISLILLSFVGVCFIRGSIDVAGNMLSLSALESIAYYSFGVIPLFVLMGHLVETSKVGRDTFDFAAYVTRRVRGGLGMATVGANAVFAAVNGTSIASASLFTKVAVPEMLRLGYSPRFSVGVVAGSSILGMLIPPSLLLILFGIIAEVSIGDLFTAGIVPGVVMSFAFMLLIAGMVRFKPDFVFSNTDVAKQPSNIRLVQLMRMIGPVAGLIVLVLGGIYGGYFTPTEAGGIGALGAFALAIARRALNGRILWNTLLETGHVTASLSFLLVGAHMYANMIALSGLPDHLGAWVVTSGLGFSELLILYLILIILMGTILDSASIMLIVIPLILPLAHQQNINLTWFGIITVVAVEIGLLTPPLGVAVFAVRSNLRDPRITLNDIFIGAAPYALIMLIVLILIVLFPSIATVLL